MPPVSALNLFSSLLNIVSSLLNLVSSLTRFYALSPFMYSYCLLSRNIFSGRSIDSTGTHVKSMTHVCRDEVQELHAKAISSIGACAKSVLISGVAPCAPKILDRKRVQAVITTQQQRVMTDYVAPLVERKALSSLSAVRL